MTKNNTWNQMDEKIRLALCGIFPNSFAKERRVSVKCSVANNPKTTPENLTMLSYDSNYNVRKSVAQNQNTPIDVLQKLAEDKNADVRKYVASNPNTSPEIIDMLVGDKDDLVRYAAVGSKNISPATLARVALREKNFGILTAVVYDDRTPGEALEFLYKKSKNFHSGIARNKNTPKELFYEMLKDKTLHWNIAWNPYAPIDVLSKIIEEGDKDAKKVAKETLEKVLMDIKS